MLTALRDVNQPMPFRAEMAKAAAPYVHPKLAATAVTVAKPPEDTGPLQQQWDDLIPQHDRLRCDCPECRTTLCPSPSPSWALPSEGPQLNHSIWTATRIVANKLLRACSTTVSVV